MNQMLDYSLIEIGISTRNRWDNLRVTLAKIAEFGLGDTRILISDDGSDEPCPFDPAESCSRVELTRYTRSAGYIVRRNEIAKRMTAKYYFSLDDDSFPAKGSFAAALQFAESHDDLFALSFPIFNPHMSRYQLPSLRSTPYRVRSYVGCSHILHRQRFLALGGYREELVHFAEEKEITARAFVRNLHCYHFPGLEIHHMASNSFRQWNRNNVYGARNTVLINDWHVPPSQKLIKQTRNFVSRVNVMIKTRHPGHLRGQLMGLWDIPRFKHNRQPMSLELYREWRRLPSA